MTLKTEDSVNGEVPSASSRSFSHLPRTVVAINKGKGGIPEEKGKKETTEAGHVSRSDQIPLGFK